jgi:hypothetical protein
MINFDSLEVNLILKKRQISKIQIQQKVWDNNPQHPNLTYPNLYSTQLFLNYQYISHLRPSIITFLSP